MRGIRTTALVGAVCVLCGCGDSSKLELVVPAALDAKTEAVVAEAWPKVKKACVGLDRYAKHLKVVGVQDNTSIDVLVAVPDSPSSIPARYMANGHTCYFNVSRDGQSLSVGKEGCKALCLDRGIKADEPLSRSDLRVEL